MSVRDNRLIFFRWLAANHPTLYAPVAREVSSSPQMAGLGWVDTLINAVVQVGGAVMAKKQADKNVKAANKQAEADRAAQLKAELLSVNLQRAQAGLPPVDENGRVLQSAQVPALPTPIQAARAAAGPNWLLIGGVGAAGLLAVLFLSRR